MNPTLSETSWWAKIIGESLVFITIYPEKTYEILFTVRPCSKDAWHERPQFVTTSCASPGIFGVHYILSVVTVKSKIIVLNLFQSRWHIEKGLVIMKVRVILLVTSVLIVSGMALTMAGCSEEEPPPMENVPTDPDYNKAPSDKDWSSVTVFRALFRLIPFWTLSDCALLRHWHVHDTIDIASDF